MNTKALFHFQEYYHIYNRTHNKEVLFKEAKNYEYFLQKYKSYISPYAEIHAYALLKNHFHFSVKVKSQELIDEYLTSLRPERLTVGIKKYLESTLKNEAIHDLIISQHHRFFISYSKSINKMYNRVGGLFQRPFKHSHFSADEKFHYMQYYLHHNARKHGVVKKFTDYDYTSYNDIINRDSWIVNVAEVIDLFGSIEEFVNFHNEVQYSDQFDGLIIE